MRKKNPFKVPDNYFENFNEDIMLKIEDVQSNHFFKNRISFSYIKWLSIAAIIAGLVIISDNIIEKKTSDSNISRQQTQVIKISEVKNDEIFNTEKHLASLQNDYYLFIEDETSQKMYSDYIDLDNL